MPHPKIYHREFEAPPTLRGSIKCFWHTVVDFTPADNELEIVPDGSAEIIFHFGSPCNIVVNGAAHLLPSPFIMGLLNNPVILTGTTRLHTLGIRCHPWTVFDLLGLAPVKNALHIFEHPISYLHPTLEEYILQDNTEEAVHILTQYFLTSENKNTSPTLQKAGKAINNANGSLPVTEVAHAAHATVRTLERSFKKSSGHTVKDVSALMRFEQARNTLWLNPKTSLAGLAHELGFTDQAHLSREFKRYTGTTPAAFARRAKAIIDAMGGYFTTFESADKTS